MIRFRSLELAREYQYNCRGNGKMAFVFCDEDGTGYVVAVGSRNFSPLFAAGLEPVA